MAEYEVSPYARAVLAELVIYATKDHLTTGLLYELWELAVQVAREDCSTPWTCARNPFGRPEQFAGRFPDMVGSAELRDLLYAPISHHPALIVVPDEVSDSSSVTG